jgi:hypothetical protein
MIILNHPMDLM